MATGNEKARKAACEWAKKIAADNTFHYGRTKWAHKYGCYFCGTQGAKKKAAPSSQKNEVAKTYCCNPFVAAAYVHGAGVAKKCGSGGMTVPLAGGNVKNLKKYGFEKIKKPSKVTDLIEGDILLTPTHAMLYIGDGKITHAKHHDNGKKGAYWNESITTEKIPTKQWTRTKEVWRYTKKGKFKDDPTPAKPVNPFVKGKNYKLIEDMNIRKGAGTNCAFVKYDELSEDAKKHVNEKGELKAGTEVTCKDVKADSKGALWIQIPSGWICGIGSTGKEFVR